jgi:hypothetical protein
MLLNPFPSLLVFGFFAPTLLRVAAALVFWYMAYAVYRHRGHAAQAHLPVVGVQTWVPWFSVVVYGFIGISLFVGGYTQIGAIVGALAALKELVWGARLRELIPLSRTAALLLLVICLSLLMTGAGAFAFDLPL